MKLSERTIKEGNKIIAEFVGMTKVGNVYLGPGRAFMPRLDYHYDWRSLIEIVAKIKRLPRNFFDKIKFDFVIGECTIQQVWRQVVKFLRWYKKTFVTMRLHDTIVFE